MGKSTFKFLGTGGSMGIPVLGCRCDVCNSDRRENHRFRCSALISIDGKKLLIDCGPDIRQQLRTFQIDDFDAVLMTHTHYDHSAGIDELRPLFFKHQMRLPLLISQEGYEDLAVRMPYLVGKEESDQVESRYFRYEIVKNTGSYTFCGLDFTICDYHQAGMRVLGFRFGTLAYLTDIRDYDSSIFDHIKGIETLVISALRFEATPIDIKSPVHFTIEEAIAFGKEAGAKKIYFTHITHDLEHHVTNKLLPENVRLAHDGLEIEFEA